MLHSKTKTWSKISAFVQSWQSGTAIVSVLSYSLNSMHSLAGAWEEPQCSPKIVQVTGEEDIWQLTKRPKPSRLTLLNYSDCVFLNGHADSLERARLSMRIGMLSQTVFSCFFLGAINFHISECFWLQVLCEAALCLINIACSQAHLDI